MKCVIILLSLVTVALADEFCKAGLEACDLHCKQKVGPTRIGNCEKHGFCACLQPKPGAVPGGKSKAKPGTVPDPKSPGKPILKAKPKTTTTTTTQIPPTEAPPAGQDDVPPVADAAAVTEAAPAEAVADA